MVALSAMRLVRTKRRQLLQVPVGELGLWPQTWNESPLIGIVLLLALAPDGDLASRCASACLMFDGGRDNLQRSSAWREVMKEAVLGDAQKGRIAPVLERSRRGTPIVVRANVSVFSVGIEVEEICAACERTQRFHRFVEHRVEVCHASDIELN